MTQKMQLRPLNERGRVKFVATTPAEIRSEFKEAFYGIGDRISTLELLKDRIQNATAERRLAMRITELIVVHNELKRFGDDFLPNWD